MKTHEEFGREATRYATTGTDALCKALEIEMAFTPSLVGLGARMTANVRAVIERALRQAFIAGGDAAKDGVR